MKTKTERKCIGCKESALDHQIYEIILQGLDLEGPTVREVILRKKQTFIKRIDSSSCGHFHGA